MSPPESRWVWQLAPGPDESFGHYLSQFRRLNCLSHKTLGAELNVPSQRVAEWEVPSRRRLPDPAQLERLAQLVRVSPTRLQQMFPPARPHLQTRLCPLCYAETPVHRVTWQQLGVDECDRHQIPLLKACPICRTGFRTPALWNNEPCLGCGQRFEQMESNQVDRAIEPS